jgi:hypothetical protein
MFSVVLGILLLGSCAPVSKADTVTYTFSGINNSAGDDGLNVAFQFTSSGFIASETSLLSVLLNSCTNCLVSSGVPAVSFLPADVYGDEIDFSDVDNFESVFNFAFGAFQADGTYVSTSPFNSGELIVSTPEPDSVLLLLAGLLCLVPLRRRKLARSE